MRAQVINLYSEPQTLSQPRADTSKTIFSDLFGKVKDALVETGRKYGVIPYNSDTRKYVDPEDAVIEPTYSGLPGVARRWYKAAAEKVAEYYGKTQGWMPVIGDNISEVVVGKLPTKWGLFLEKTKDGYQFVKKVVGKIYGAFDPQTKRLYLDTANFPEVADPEKPYLRASGLPINTGLETPVHELTHTVQDNRGTLDRYSREDIEGETSIVTEEILGRPISGMYPLEKEQYREKYGDRKITQLPFGKQEAA
ncbi:MAG TPA: hypothetical protein VJA47_03665 [archaeon]|nr:hypothetical protein [archaeon]